MSTVRPVVAIVTAMEEYQTRVLTSVRTTLADHDVPLIVHCDGPIERGVDSTLLVDLLRESSPSGVLCMNSMTLQQQEDLSELLDSLGLPSVYIGTPHVRRVG